MRTLRRVSLALLMVAVFAAAASAQTSRLSFNAAVGPSFGNVGTTFSTVAGVDVKLHDRASIVGEFGVLPQAPFRDAAEIAPPVADGEPDVNAYHWNANLKVRPLERGRFQTYVTGGLGSFTADTILNEEANGLGFEDRRRMTDFATNVGAGVSYRLADWVGVGVDYRTFFVHRDGSTPRVNRFTAGLTFSTR